MVLPTVIAIQQVRPLITTGGHAPSLRAVQSARMANRSRSNLLCCCCVMLMCVVVVLLCVGVRRGFTRQPPALQHHQNSNEQKSREFWAFGAPPCGAQHFWVWANHDTPDPEMGLAKIGLAKVGLFHRAAPFTWALSPFGMEWGWPTGPLTQKQPISDNLQPPSVGERLARQDRGHGRLAQAVCWTAWVESLYFVSCLFGQFFWGPFWAHR